MATETHEQKPEQPKVPPKEEKPKEPEKPKTQEEENAEKTAAALKAESLDSKGKEIKLGDKVKFEGVVVDIGPSTHFDNVTVLGTATPKPAAFGAVVLGGLPRNHYKFQAYQLEVEGSADKPEEKKEPELIGLGNLDPEGKTQLYKAPPDFVVKSEEQKAKEALDAELKKAAEEAEKAEKLKENKENKTENKPVATQEETRGHKK